MRVFYYRGLDEEELVIHVNKGTPAPLSIRATEEDESTETAMVSLPADEIDNLIAALQTAKKELRL